MTQGVEGYVRVDTQQGLFKIPRSAYSDPAIALKEQRKVFETCWLYIGHDSELDGPGAFVRREVAGRDLVFNRDAKGIVHAFHNVCPHRGGRVCRQKQGKARSFQCFYHGWVFGADGALQNLPNRPLYSVEFQRTAPGLAAVPRLEQYADFWFINFDADAMSLFDYLAGAKEYLDLIQAQSAEKMRVLAGGQEYSIRANWKMLAENSTDPFHFEPTHAAYRDFLRDRIDHVKASEPDAFDTAETMASTTVDRSSIKDLGNGHAVVEYVAPWGRPVAQWHPTWGSVGKDEIDRVYARLEQRLGRERAERIALRSRNLVLFPNLAIIDAVAIAVRTFYSDAGSSNHMKVQSWGLAPAEESAWLREKRLENYVEFLGPGGFGTPDDVEAMEMCQSTYRTTEGGWNDISGGMQTDEGETTLRAFWSEWNRCMTATGGSE